MRDINFDDTEDESDQDDENPKGYVLLDFDSSLDAWGALYALRIVRNARVYRRVFERSRYIDDDIIALLGLAPSNKRSKSLDIYPLRSAIARQTVLTGASAPYRRDALVRNVEKLGDVLRLTYEERCILHLAIVAAKVPGFSDLWSSLKLSQEGMCEAVARAAGVHARTVGRALRRTGRLSRSGLFVARRPLSDDSNPLELNERACGALTSPRFEIEQFLRHLVRKGGKPRLTLDDFAHVPDAGLVRRYLADASARHRKGVNILLYGLPGTGKTEFVRALASALKLELHEVPNEDEDGDPIRGNERFSSYTICQKILDERRQQLILFDEVEDVFGAGAPDIMALFGRVSNDSDCRIGKSWTNEVLETNPVPTVWVCNDIGAMDSAYIRRFDLVVEFRAPGPAAARRVIGRYFKPGEISDACAERLAAIETLPPAQIERAAKVVRSLRSRSVERRDREAGRVIDASLRAMGLKATAPAATLPSHYDPAFVNADRDLHALIGGLARGHAARMCFYGPPGTGKTAFAHYLGRELALPVQVKRGSDLLGRYVGETEANIAKAFQSARDARAILVIDEADGFLRDRAGASRSWEVTQVNELLTQMEAFEGIFVASTNLIDTLDAASLRRFDFKVKFDYLTRGQRRALLERVTAVDPAGGAIPDDVASRLDQLDRLTPGDYATVSRQLQVTGQPAKPRRFVERLAAEVAMKSQHDSRPIGFTAHLSTTSTP